MRTRHECAVDGCIKRMDGEAYTQELHDGRVVRVPRDVHEVVVDALPSGEVRYHEEQRTLFYGRRVSS